MATDSLVYTLGLLRRLKSTPNVNLGHATINFVREWIGSHVSLEIAKLVIAIQENLEAAHIVISESGLNDEAKSGLFETIGGLKAAFSFENLNNAPSSYLPSIDPAITNFAIVTSSIGVTIPEEAINEIGILISELNDFSNKVDEFEISKNVKMTVKRHVSLLIALLNNVQAVGLEPAISAYYDLILALRKEKAADGGEGSGSGNGLWGQIKEWSSRFESISNLIDQGSMVLPYLQALPRIAGF